MLTVCQLTTYRQSTPLFVWVVEARGRESNLCTSLKRAYAFPRVRLAVARLLLEFRRWPPASQDRVSVADESAKIFTATHGPRPR
jgi:hypothetical protein